MAPTEDTEERETRRRASRDEWLEHPFTLALKKDAETWKAVALTNLILHCKQSSDPKVVERYHQYATWELVAKLTKTGEKSQ